MIAILLLGATDPASQPAVTAMCAVLVAFCSASQDIVIDAYRIELLDDHQQGAGAAMTQIGYRFGMIASGAGYRPRVFSTTIAGATASICETFGSDGPPPGMR